MYKSLLLVACAVAATPSWATITVQLSSSLSSPQPIATPVTFTATATDTIPGALDYQFSAGTTTMGVFQAFDIGASAVYAPFAHPGTYTIQVTARNLTSGESKSATESFTYSSYVKGTTPVISPTVHPLVALYSAPGCPLGSFMYVKFTRPGVYQQTNEQPCGGAASSVNFYIAGMLPQTTYTMNYVVVTGSVSTSGPSGTFTTGSIPSTLEFPTLTFPDPVNNNTSLSQDILLLDYLASGPTGLYMPTAIDLTGRILWYYPAFATVTQDGTFGLRPAYSNGNMWVIAEDPNTVGVTGQVLRQIDLAGNTVKQTSATEVNVQLASLGEYPINGFDHDIIELPNGHVIVKCTQEKIYPPGTQPQPANPTAPVDVLGDALVDMDANFNVTWYWSGYDHLNINRPAVLGETCGKGQPGCGPILLSSVANDWLHGNSLNYIPSSGDLLFSMRHQDWIAKINYANGAGYGNVIWELGNEGNWTIQSSDPYPWFSHQHDAEYELESTSLLSLFDNGNTRVSLNPGEHSRGYVLSMDESALTCTPLMLADIGVFSQAVGSAQRLNNGNYYFEAGLIPGQPSESQELLFPSGALNWEMTDSTTTYRGYRMVSMYRIDAPGN